MRTRIIWIGEELGIPGSPLRGAGGYKITTRPAKFSSNRTNAKASMPGRRRPGYSEPVSGRDAPPYHNVSLRIRRGCSSPAAAGMALDAIKIHGSSAKSSSLTRRRRQAKGSDEAGSCARGGLHCHAVNHRDLIWLPEPRPHA